MTNGKRQLAASSSIMPPKDLHSRMKSSQHTINGGARAEPGAYKRKRASVPIRTADPSKFYNKRSVDRVVGVDNRGARGGRWQNEESLVALYSASDQQQESLFGGRRSSARLGGGAKRASAPPKPVLDTNKDDPICISSDDEEAKVRRGALPGGRARACGVRGVLTLELPFARAVPQTPCSGRPTPAPQRFSRRGGPRGRTPTRCGRAAC